MATPTSVLATPPSGRHITEPGLNPDQLTPLPSCELQEEVDSPELSSLARGLWGRVLIGRSAQWAGPGCL
ncbi:hypothetical protein EYF80_065034 [Liparis tanakae]|uniref:Uncharacterized protein n=1 Tax=Liparis tanakae TaxID=230148 RepID=A0A4Z2E8D8_9TELE|nr:hypothetical protein EYF80_065034 [Liparis tanakae]